VLFPGSKAVNEALKKEKLRGTSCGEYKPKAAEMRNESSANGQFAAVAASVYESSQLNAHSKPDSDEGRNQRSQPGAH
jgi:hypothetical protein